VSDTLFLRAVARCSLDAGNDALAFSFVCFQLVELRD
jgi:hypothetical protein